MTIWNGLTSDGAVVPIQVDDQGRVVAVGSGPDSPLVVDGDYLRPRDPDLGLGTANINLDASGGASFGGGLEVDGSATFEGQLTSGGPSNGQYKAISPDLGGDPSGADAFVAAYDGDVVVKISYDGSAAFRDLVRVDGTFRSIRTSNGNAYEVYLNGSLNVFIKADGSAVFNDTVRVGEASSFNSADMRIQGSNADKRGALVLQKDDSSATQDGITFIAGRGTSAVISYSGSTTFNLEYDNPDRYTSTTNAEGETVSVYNGLTLDVKDSLMDLTAAMTAIRIATQTAGTLDDLKAAIASATEPWS